MSRYRRFRSSKPEIALIQEPTVTDNEIVSEMLATGGSFIKALASAFCAADPDNKALIKATWAAKFRDYGTAAHYRKLARQAEEVT